MREEEASPALLTGCASRATGHPQRRSGPGAPRRPGQRSGARFAGAWTPRTARPTTRSTGQLRGAAPGGAPLGPRVRGAGLCPSAPGHPGPEGGQSPAAPPATQVRPPELDRPDAASSEGQPRDPRRTLHPEPRTPDPIPDLDPDPQPEMTTRLRRGRRWSARAPTHPPAPLRSQQQPRLPRSLTDFPRGPRR